MMNRLANAQSLYLRKHAENPIDWWPWCEEAIALARQENLPIFLSIGYSSCHWCTVMEGEAFSNLEIADYMNAHYVAIKVDREERPDVDSIYMQALQMMTGAGGWPLNVFLDPETLLPFYGGTYFPVHPRYGRPGFLRVLQELKRIYESDRPRLQSVQAEIQARFQQTAALSAAESLDNVLLQKGLQYCAGILSARDMGPSFPMIPYAEAALRGIRFADSEPLDDATVRYDAREQCRQRGLDLALGGIFDHVAGGFHRYTVDPTWTVPHFEKMLYDNGQIVEYLANLWAAGMQEPAFERAIALTVQWLQREMTAPEGYFYAAQDADSFAAANDGEPEEGAFYVWRYADLEAQFSEAALQELAEHFTLTPAGNFEGQNVLQRRQPGILPDSVEQSLAALFAIRYGSAPEAIATFPPARNNEEAKTHAWPGRIPAVTDTKMIVAWNSLMISGLARAAAALQREDYFHLANRAADFIWQQQIVEGRLHRLNYDGAVSVLAQSEDYALLIKALLDLDQAALALASRSDIALAPIASSDLPAHFLDRALTLQAEFDAYLGSDEGGYYNTDARADLILRERSYDDSAVPAANGVAIANLIRLFLRAGRLDYLDKAQHALLSFGSVMEKTPQVCPSLFIALDWLQTYTLVKTSGDRLPFLLSQYHPTTMFAAESDLPAESIGLVCQGLSCNEPARSVAQLLEQLRQSEKRKMKNEK
ncbi:thioredoxin domain-containing protein [Thermoleptolyngbya sp. M55_K2018_002]|uniref:thioredoxin domain-containing protein n=1 Tax=Thermoleptolyngbya sp. M55_K2018_002 TaxID=2747808 RepID=UPI0019EDC66C|nr:thioredoxin domain-containing protein [Thermoleptolyngbya sp. M55_K2018_002]